MKRWGINLFIILLLADFSCVNARQKDNEADVQIITQYGNIRIRLYTNTVEHRKNFEKLVKEDFYEGLLFHRVIENFMIQGGDPDSKRANPGQRLGGGSLDYTLPAEFFPGNFHKRGAIAAARLGGPSNPEKRSSASQFYIVQGTVLTEEALNNLEVSKNQQLLNEVMREQLAAVQEEMERYRAGNDRDGFNRLVAEVRERADSIMAAQGLGFSLTAEQREFYTTTGGYPSLDGDYTVFGEVVEGMEVVDRIAAGETDSNDRPLVDVKMKIEWLN